MAWAMTDYGINGRIYTIDPKPIDVPIKREISLGYGTVTLRHGHQCQNQLVQHYYKKLEKECRIES